MKQIEQPFEELMIPRRELQNNSAMRYRVYRDTKSYKLVEAISALDALTRSGISKAYKIERYNPLSDNIVHLGQVEKLLSGENVADIDDVADVADVKANDVLPIKTEPEAIAEIVQPAPESTVPEQTPEQQIVEQPVLKRYIPEMPEIAEDDHETVEISLPVEARPLSNADVDKLLNG